MGSEWTVWLNNDLVPCHPSAPRPSRSYRHLPVSSRFNSNFRCCQMSLHWRLCPLNSRDGILVIEWRWKVPSLQTQFLHIWRCYSWTVFSSTLPPPTHPPRIMNILCTSSSRVCDMRNNHFPLRNILRWPVAVSFAKRCDFCLWLKAAFFCCAVMQLLLSVLFLLFAS